MNSKPVRTVLCVRIGIDDDGVHCVMVCRKRSDGIMPRNDLTSLRLHITESIMTVRGQSMRTQLYSKYNRNVITSGNDFLNFNSIFITIMRKWSVSFRRASVRCKTEE